MKLRKFLCVCGLSLTTVLGGCGMVAPGETKVDDGKVAAAEDGVQQESQDATSEEAGQQESQEITSEDASTEATSSEENTTEAAKDEAKEESQGGEIDVAQGDDVEKAIAEYKQILKAAPAIEGEHEELQDAGFGYEENQAMFGNHYDCFAIEDIDKDGTPELIASSIVNFSWAPISIYTYHGGKVVLLKDPANVDAHGTFEQSSTANGSYVTYICGEDHIHSVWRGTNPMGEPEEENSAYIVNGTELTPIDCTSDAEHLYVYFNNIAKSNVAANVDAITKE